MNILVFVEFSFYYFYNKFNLKFNLYLDRLMLLSRFELMFKFSIISIFSKVV